MSDCWKRIMRSLTKSKRPIVPESLSDMSTPETWYASIIAWDDENQSWRVIGVIANNTHGDVLIRINKNDRLVRRTSSYKVLEETYNREFQEGEATHYKRDPDEMSSHIEHIKTNDPRFLQKYAEEMVVEDKHIRLFRFRMRTGTDLSECIDSLLLEALRAGYSARET